MAYTYSTVILNPRLHAQSISRQRRRSATIRRACHVRAISRLNFKHPARGSMRGSRERGAPCRLVPSSVGARTRRPTHRRSAHRSPQCRVPRVPPASMLRPALALAVLAVAAFEVRASWEEWWTYDGISGPAFWGLINPQWNLCNKGRRQSPVNVEPSALLFDPHLTPIHVDKHKVSGTLWNTGQSLVLRVDGDTKHHVNISGGPLAYRYQFEEIYVHYGTENHQGSEHRIHGHAFPAELQLYGFNAELYRNMSEAQHRPHGLAAIALMLQIGETPNPELRLITSAFSKLTYRGSHAAVRHLSLRSLLPDTDHYMTYEGSTTHPGCWETAVWVILNKPIYITKQELYALRRLMQGPEETPKAPLGNNVRPLQPLHHRTIRTNIDFEGKNQQPQGTAEKCASRGEVLYKANSRHLMQPERVNVDLNQL